MALKKSDELTWHLGALTSSSLAAIVFINHEFMRPIECALIAIGTYINLNGVRRLELTCPFSNFFASGILGMYICPVACDQPLDIVFFSSKRRPILRALRGRNGERPTWSILNRMKHRQARERTSFPFCYLPNRCQTPAIRHLATEHNRYFTRLKGTYLGAGRQRTKKK